MCDPGRFRAAGKTQPIETKTAQNLTLWDLTHPSIAYMKGVLPAEWQPSALSVMLSFAAG